MALLLKSQQQQRLTKKKQKRNWCDIQTHIDEMMEYYILSLRRKRSNIFYSYDDDDVDEKFYNWSILSKHQCGFKNQNKHTNKQKLHKIDWKNIFFFFVPIFVFFLCINYVICWQQKINMETIQLKWITMKAECHFFFIEKYWMQINFLFFNKKKKSGMNERKKFHFWRAYSLYWPVIE